MSRSTALRRLAALVRKEWLQMKRDPSAFAVALGLPLLLVLIFGYGLSMDLRNVPAAVVLGDAGPTAEAVARRFRASPYFRARIVPTRAEAEALLDAHEVSLILEIPNDFERRLAEGGADLGLTIHGVDAGAANVMRSYASGAVALALETEREGLDTRPGSALSALSTRAWFNEANASAWYLVPGLLVVISALVSSFMGSIVVAREFERGTMTSLAVTPASTTEVLAAKAAANFALGAAGIGIAASAAALLFDLPMRGSAALFGATLLFSNAWALAFGLFLSALLKRQFVAIQLAVIGSYLPALMLSGYIFDLRSVPAWIEAVGRLMPSTYAIESVKILVLSGGSEALVFADLAILAAAALIFFALALLVLKKRRTPAGGAS